MFGDSIQSDGGVDGGLSTAMRNDVDDAGRTDGHIQDPKFYPSWAPELSRQSKTGDDNPVSKDIPLLRELDRKYTMRRDGIQKSKKKTAGERHVRRVSPI